MSFLGVDLPKAKEKKADPPDHGSDLWTVALGPQRRTRCHADSRRERCPAGAPPGVRRRPCEGLASSGLRDSGRLELQRTNEWIQTELEALAIEQSDLLSARPDERTGTVRFRVLPQPH
ncbi:hypothetical protein SMICM17S_07847 [Streptomyces microflavus]